MFDSFWALLFVSFSATGIGGFDNYVTERFFSSGLIPDILDVPPSIEAQVQFGLFHFAHLGNTLTPTQTKPTPFVTWPADLFSMYTLIMLDPDSPSRKMPIFRSLCHLLVGNIPLGIVNLGERISPYVRPQPVQNTGYHRFVVLLYKQKKKLDFSAENSTREAFSLREFMRKYGLGNPVAGNFFIVQHDKSVSPEEGFFDPFLNFRRK